MEFVRKAIALSHTFIILIVVAIAFTCHNEWQEVEALEVGNRHIDEFRKEVNRIHIQLIEFSLLGETALDWDETDLENYHAQRIALDSTLCLFNETHVIGRIDSVRSLLEDKERQMFQIVRLIDEQQSINKKIASQVPLIVQTSMQEQPKKPKRKGFLGIFGKKEETKPPTTTTTLRSPNRSMVSEQKEQSRRLSEQADSLAARNADLNRQLKGLICQIENKVQADLQGREDEIVAMRGKSFMQVGGLMGFKSDKSFNVRIIAATNEDLEAAVSEKRFRQDLLYRLQDFVITVPPLRDCQEDIMPLAEFFREIANKELECNVSGFSSEARKALLTHAWPGNVRELRQKIMGAVLQAQEGVVTKEHLELAVTKPTSPVSFALRNDAEDKERIMRALKQTNGNRSAAAELLGISRATLYSKLEEYGLKYKFKQS